MRSNTTLKLEAGAVLRGSRDPNDYCAWKDDQIEPIVEYQDEHPVRSAYPYSRWNNAIIRALDAHDVAIVGEPGSFIDGRNCFDELGEEKYRGPHAINMWKCENLTLEGYTITDSANWAHAIFNTNNITVRNVTVYGGHDGLDIRTCDNVLIEDCTFLTGDDAIAGFDNRDVIIRRCHMDSSCSALRFGGTRVLVEDCTSSSPTSFGFRQKLSYEAKRNGDMPNEECRHFMRQFFNYYCDFRAEIRETPGDIVIKNCEIADPSRLLSLDFDGGHIWCCNRSLRSIRFENCRVTDVERPINIYGDANEPLIMELCNVTLSAKKGFEDAAIIEAKNFERITLNNVTYNGFSDPRVVMITEGIMDGDCTPRIEKNNNA